jgi:predicted enzyme related to lactoylglutathione lyase
VGEAVEGVGGIFFRARDPAALRAWYAEHLSFPADTGYFGPGGQQLMVNFRVRDLDAMLVQLRDAGVHVDDRVEKMEYGRFAWASDLEGNRFELWEPS